MDTDLALWSLAVTALALVGFCRPPSSFYELLMPRFVVPTVVWLATAANTLWWAESRLHVINRAYDQYAAAAMQYVALCLVVFWVGFFTPIGRLIGRRAPYMPVDLRKHSTVFLIGCLGLLAVQHSGPFLLELIPPLAGVIQIFVRIGPFGSAVLLGLYLGSQRRLNAGHLMLAALLLFIATIPLMARFSRGVGLPLFISMIAFSYMRRQVKVVPILIAALAVVYCGVQGLRGRSVWGHGGGMPAYLGYLVSEPPTPEALIGGVKLVHDSLTPTAVAILAREEPASYTGTMTPTDWLLNCIPLPRAVGLPRFTVSLGSYIAGREISWGYTAGIFGDTRHNLGVWGALMFWFVGVYYRVLEEASFRKFGGHEFTSEWYSFFCILSYYAFVIGMYNTYRAWLTLCTFGVYAALTLILLKMCFGSPSKPPSPVLRFTTNPSPYPHQ